MRKSLLFFILGFVFLFLIFSRFSSTAALSAGAAVQEAPAKPSADSMARAKELYKYDCAVCHGVNGDGKGDMSADFPGKIRDWTDPASLKDYTDDKLFTIIRDGAGEMPPEGQRAKKNELWALVALVRSFAKK
jgi:mono/diheme cytochrome c family protein